MHWLVFTYKNIIQQQKLIVITTNKRKGYQKRMRCFCLIKFYFDIWIFFFCSLLFLYVFWILSDFLAIMYYWTFEMFCTRNMTLFRILSDYCTTVLISLLIFCFCTIFIPILQSFDFQKRYQCSNETRTINLYLDSWVK